MVKNKPILLDLFCKAGGATKGYQEAGFYVVGVDIKPQPHYCGDEFYQADALTYPLYGYDAFHASPPCQRFSAITQQHGKTVVESHPDLIVEVRTRLLATGKPCVMENVPKAPLINSTTLCGSMFDLHSGVYHLRRHRKFETSFFLWPPASCCHIGKPLPVYGHPGGSSCRDHQKFGSSQDWRIGMGIDWMTIDELAEALPPAYTKYVGKYLMIEVLHGKNTIQKE